MSSTNAYKILMVDDEPNVLAGYQRTVGRKHALTIAQGGAAGLAALTTQGPFAVVITDMRMPNMTGLEFLEAARAKTKETVFMMLTGNADQQTAVDAINRGQIFRFLNKPCAAELLDAAIAHAIRQHELITAERVLLRGTFTGSIKLLVDALELGNPELAVIQGTVKKVHQDLCAALGIPRDWQMTVAASLCLLGMVALPGLQKDESLCDSVLQQAASLGHRLINNLPRLSTVAAMILHQRDPGNLPADLTSLTTLELECAGAQLLRFSVDLARAQRHTGSLATAVTEMNASGKYDPRLIAALGIDPLGQAAAPKPVVQKLFVTQLQPGMELDSDIRNSSGILILSSGQQLSELSIASLCSYADRGAITKAVMVRIFSNPAKAA
jgi:CheY-like chemotaxis protein